MTVAADGRPPMARPTDRGALATGGGGLADARIEAPHILQKFMPEELCAPHAGQVSATG
jgi:hypothetical protein